MTLSTPEQQNTRDAGHFHLESRQLSRRLRDLLPERLKSIENDYRQHHSAARSLRLALIDPRWIATVEEYVDRLEDSEEARIRWQVGCMLNSAEKSINSWHRALNNIRVQRQRHSGTRPQV